MSVEQFQSTDLIASSEVPVGHQLPARGARYNGRDVALTGNGFARDKSCFPVRACGRDTSKSEASHIAFLDPQDVNAVDKHN
jgi:hypothetical protein